MATGLNSTFKLSGRLDLPTYPGFIVMNILQVDFIYKSKVPSKSNLFFLSFLAV